MARHPLAFLEGLGIETCDVVGYSLGGMVAELAKRGVPCRMKSLSPYCTGEAGPSEAGEWGDEQ